MKGRLLTVLMIVLTLVSGGIAVYFSQQYIEKTIAAKEREIDKEYTPIQVVVARHDLQPGDVLSSQTVALRKVPSGFVHDDAIKSGEFSSVNGYALSYPITEGKTVLRSHISERKGGKFASLINDGKRAVTISIDTLASAAGMLSPNDKVDMLLTTQKNRTLVTAPLLGNIQVIATGVETSENLAGEVKQYSTVTLNLTPEEAAKVTHARKIGEISFTLRNGGEQGTPYPKAISKSNLLSAEKASYTSVRPVKIIIGGQ